MSLVTMGTIAGSKPGSNPPAPADIAFVQQIASDQIASATSGAFSVTANTSAGNLIVLMIAVSNSRTVTSVTDSKSNTYSIKHTTGGSFSLTMVTSVITSALTTSDTITVNTNNTATFRLIGAELTNQDATPLDKVTGSNGSSVTTLATGSTGTLSTTPEVVLTAIALNSGSGGFSAEPTGYTALTAPTPTATLAGYKTVNATTALNESWTWAIARNCSTLIATFK